ncbi:AraC family transcriptional regulator [Paenibacillus polymyxa]|uniref:AraC family transcriptional regulator n=1 Tax=Paenibacillus TaxID=44249 RepID=UPI000F50DA70|nr:MULTISPECIES: AraC family transcriptional regulator [Paenibacillus]KAF6655203.1 AraC family transcriptional regulator [Paenibacillus sp. EKM301P]RPE03941.1 AraC family transcriptional regulator [Paenibacillus polymyxa]UBS89543.1 AraC family transcriptional regulator [Paenibacillus polymyxa]WHX38234.1 AraC family transcriptional regulator [Paenibacillus polymyxa]
MDYALGNMVVHIHWVLAKPPLPGWEDIRQTVSGHTFYYIYSGKGTFRCEEKDIEVGGGTLVYLWPGLPLYMKSSDAHPLRMTMLLFDCASLMKNENKWGTPKPIEQLRLPFLMPLQSERAGRIGGQFREAEREWVPGDLVQEARVKSVWYRLVQEVHEAAEAGGRHNDGDGIVEALRKFKEKLDTGFATELRITELAEQTGFSPVYLRRTFASRYGCSPKEYLNHLRNEHAVRRLRFTSDSVTDIARACGYSDVYQFSKTFKKRNGLPPIEYRRMQGN